MPKGQENIRRQFRALAGPIFVETFLVMLLGAIDSLMLSQYSDDKVASAGMANQLSGDRLSYLFSRRGQQRA